MIIIMVAAVYLLIQLVYLCSYPNTVTGEESEEEDIVVIVMMMVMTMEMTVNHGAKRQAWESN